MSAPLAGVEACVFDAYGTLFDVHAAARRCADKLGGKADALSMLWRTKQLEYTWLRGLMGRHATFWKVTGDALDFALAALDIEPGKVREQLMAAYREPVLFPEIERVLERLREADLRLAILSNGSPRMLADAVEHTGIAPRLEAVLSVDEVGVFKPHPAVYELASRRLGVLPQAISFQSANAWDAVAAATFGMRVVWCNRYEQKPERLTAQPDFEVETLDGLLPLLGL